MPCSGCFVTFNVKTVLILPGEHRCTHEYCSYQEELGLCPKRYKKNEGIPEDRDYPQQRQKGGGLRKEEAAALGPGVQTKLAKSRLLHLWEAHSRSCLLMSCSVHGSVQAHVLLEIFLSTQQLCLDGSNLSLASYAFVDAPQAFLEHCL